MNLLNITNEKIIAQKIQGISNRYIKLAQNKEKLSICLPCFGITNPKNWEDVKLTSENQISTHSFNWGDKRGVLYAVPKDDY
jgi:hypothetical protein